MKFIRRLSYKGARYLSIKLNESNEARRVYYYGLQIIIGEIIKFASFLLIIIFIDTLNESVAILIFYSVVRIVAGGYHMKDYTRCMVTSFILFIILSLALKYLVTYIPIPVLTALSLAALAISLFVAYKWAPRPALPKTPEQMAKAKRFTIAIVFLWFALNYYFIITANKFWIQAGISGMLLADLALSPLSEKIFGHVDKN